jgi:acyl-[acyl-carrier-protein]-phospholipid O-acyltransferase/long-chain-fatty-acid--[acyl-carrier-protein] ligase
MINFTAGAANVTSGMWACQARTILTSKAFVEQGKLQPLVDALAAEFEIVWLEDVKA